LSGLVQQYKDFIANFEKGQLVGIDIGLSSVKVCLLSKPKKNVFKLEKYASISLSEAAIIEDEVQKPDEIIEAIAKALEEASITKKICNIGMDGPNTMTKRFNVPDGTKEDVEDNILWESEQYIPFGADDSEVDYFVIGDIPEDEVKDVLVAAIRIDIAEAYMEYVKSLGLIPKVIDLNVLAINNVFEFVNDKDLEAYNEDGVIIIDFGAQTTSVVVYKNGGPTLTKEINVGGVLITEEIQRIMGVSYDEAEDLKKHGDEKGNLPEEIVSIIEGQISSQIAELRKVLNFYIATGSSEQISDCLITGGGAKLPGLIEALVELIDGQVSILNPFEVIQYDKKKFSEQQIESIMTSGLVSLGLAMRSI
jgi:type IV pilus assembly protein PilM